MPENQIGFESQTEKLILQLFAAAGAIALWVLITDRNNRENRAERERKSLRKLKEDLDSLDKEDA